MVFDDDMTDYNNFIINDDLPSMTNIDKMILLMYFASTSLSTVGFGDFHPISSPERLFAVAVLLFGVMIFSYIMGEFIEILDNYKNLEADLDEGDELQRFFGLMTYLNEGVPINIELKNNIEAYFDYKW